MAVKAWVNRSIRDWCADIRLLVTEWNQISTLSSTGKSHGFINRKPSQGKTRFDSERVYEKLVKNERRWLILDYIIRNKSGLYIKLNENGTPITCGENQRELFEYSKATNICNSLPKTLKKFKFYIFPQFFYSYY